MSSHARYLAWLGAGVALLMLVPALNFAVIVRSGELAPLPQVVAGLQESGGIHGTGLHDVRGELPLEIARQRAPEVLALGSSRAFYLRQEYFTRPFACACGTMDSIDDAVPFLDALLERARPRVVLFAQDFWWYTTDRPQRSKPLDLGQPVRLTRDKILRPSEWVRHGTLTPTDYVRLLAGQRELHGVTHHPKTGIMAIKRSIGMRRDGSQLDGIRFSADALSFYAEARAQLEAPRAFVMGEGAFSRAAGRYGPDKRLVAARLEALDTALAKLRSAGARVIVYLPPLAPPVAAAMAATGRHDYIDELRAALVRRGDEFYDFHDPATLGANLCEFADAHHGGDVASMRILRAILRRGGSVLEGYADAAQLDAAIARNAGRTIARLDGSESAAVEIDFLAAGCRDGHK